MPFSLVRYCSTCTASIYQQGILFSSFNLSARQFLQFFSNSIIIYSYNVKFIFFSLHVWHLLFMVILVHSFFSLLYIYIWILMPPLIRSTFQIDSFQVRTKSGLTKQEPNGCAMLFNNCVIARLCWRNQKTYDSINY